MRVFTLDELRTIMRQSAGDWEDVHPGGDIEDTPYADLGYDSLALLEISARIEQTLRVRVDEGAVNPSATPRETVTAVNTQLSHLAGIP